MPVERSCKVCGKKILVYTTIQNKCRDCTIKNSKPIPQRGKQARMWETFRDKVAIPYLDNKYGHVCSLKGCNVTTRLDVDHIKKRGSNPGLKFDVKNLRYLCRPHHIQETDRLHWTKKA
ncbi:HNH endonuclease signature motif containing protein [Arthrobacter cavernae]|uniref:HNH endonuclease n=1 Tax=Arthrobacter cavernae TaxID=2817681 RepID=A0A939HGI4_9MICC|nr:HNH endonuclease [Arthrobacter cavernae]MBO1267065.1 HNH endonuclease [Arthrobacter cavernae]